MTALTPLGQQRADTVCVHQAARALRAGCRPEQVVAFLAAYVGLPLTEPEPLTAVTWTLDGFDLAGETWTTVITGTAPIRGDLITVTRPPTKRRRWWSR